jgi:4-coumarate--CoA ligase
MELIKINYPTAIWGVLRLGAVPTCANPTYTERELAYQLSVSGAKYLIVQSASLAMALLAAKTANIPSENVIIIDSHDPNYSSIDDLAVQGKSLPAIQRISFRQGESRERLAFLSFSSGTSGLPKGVMISHGNLIANICQAYEVDKEQIHPGKRLVGCGCLPFYHSTCPTPPPLTQFMVSFNFCINLWFSESQ